jgi:hypothetical protein
VHQPWSVADVCHAAVVPCVVCGVWIGGAKPPPKSDWPSRLDISHYELLLRIAANLARISGSVAERVRYLMLAAHYVHAMWDSTINTLNTAAAEKVRCSPLALPLGTS